MIRPQRSFVLGLSALAATLLSVACSSAPEQQVLQQYFTASRMRDNVTLGNIATVSFDPMERGSIQSFDIVSASMEEKRPLRVKELAAAEEAARLADEEFNKKKKEYQDANLRAIERVVAAEQKRVALRGPDLAIQQAWTKWRDDSGEYAKKLTDARRALSDERILATPSLAAANPPVDPAMYEGELLTKDVMVKADVRMPDGSTKPTDLRIRFTRADITSGPNGTPVTGKWIITEVTDAAAAPQS